MWTDLTVYDTIPIQEIVLERVTEEELIARSIADEENAFLERMNFPGRTWKIWTAEEIALGSRMRQLADDARWKLHIKFPLGIIDDQLHGVPSVPVYTVYEGRAEHYYTVKIWGSNEHTEISFMNYNAEHKLTLYVEIELQNCSDDLRVTKATIEFGGREPSEWDPTFVIDTVHNRARALTTSLGIDHDLYESFYSSRCENRAGFRFNVISETMLDTVAKLLGKMPLTFDKICSLWKASSIAAEDSFGRELFASSESSDNNYYAPVLHIMRTIMPTVPDVQFVEFELMDV